MAYWDSDREEIIYRKSKPYPDYPDWEMIDCGCCAGIMWGGEYIRECNRCACEGWIAHHKPSGVLAHYPGGPFCGKI